MAAVPSTMLDLGTKAPEFNLPDFNGKIFNLSELSLKNGIIIVFWCNHCPYVKHLKQHFASIAKKWQAKGFVVCAIQSNDFNKYPDDSPARMKEDADTFGYTFPYLVDEKQQVAKAYRAACTPDFYLFNSDLKLVYRGQYDSSRPSNGIEVTGSDLEGALLSLLHNRPVITKQTPSIGCNIKWREGNEPDYFKPRS